ncbi:MAG: hypothetical protein HC848_08100 [Limnobacter sp.]|nr:hypothetical protein [Limnobacter sp.]
MNSTVQNLSQLVQALSNTLHYPTHAHTATTSLCMDSVDLAELARTHGTPLYAYSATHIREAWLEYANACKGLAQTTIAMP